MSSNATKTIADNLRDELILLGRSKRMKVRTLMKYFNYEKRTEDSATHITELLNERNVIVHPSIMKMGDEWQLKFDHHVYLSINTQSNIENPVEEDRVSENWNSDKWFDSLNEKEYRTEKEVESKFLIPLLTRLGYGENDRYDGMPVSASHGSKPTRLEVDYALFNTEIETLKNQVFLIAEGKNFKDSKSQQARQEDARNQVKSYAYWVSCHFGLITDGKIIEVISLYPTVGGKKIIFKCRQDELKNTFKDLYKIVSRDSLTRYYEKLLKIQG
jgi:hypothetical protein